MPKLSGHTQNHRLWDALPLIERLAPFGLHYWKVIDPPADIAQKVADLGVKLVVRHFVEEIPASADHFYSSARSQPWYSFAWAVETPNEPFAEWDIPLWYLSLEERLVQLFRQDGKECIVNNLGTGNSGHFVPGATFYGTHEYGWPYPLSQRPWHGLRYRDWFPSEVLAHNPSATLFLTEFGSTQLVVDPNAGDIGYHSGGISPADYWSNGISPYLFELEQDPYVEVAFYFQMGGFGDWATHDGLGLLDLYFTALYESQRSVSPVGYREQYKDLFQAWEQAGGVENNFLAFVAGQKAARGEALTAEEIEAVIERAQSTQNEMALLARRPSTGSGDPPKG